MPELPEVETLRRLLTHHLVPARILDACFLSPVILRGIPFPQFASQVIGTTIVLVERRGKFLLLALADATGGVCRTDGATGDPSANARQSARGKAEDAPDKYLCASLALDKERELRFYDMWRWGEWWLVPPFPQPTGIEGLDSWAWSRSRPNLPPRICTADFRRRGPIKPLLLGQRVVAGLGNIYCDESLHRAGLHPARRANAVNAEKRRGCTRPL